MISPARPWTVGVVGATGYAGAELVRLLLDHPAVRLAAVVSRSRAGEALGDVFAGLDGATDLVFQDGDPAPLRALDSVFLAVPHGTAAPWVQALAGGPRILDLSADHRHAPGWVYGQCEWNGRPLRSAQQIAVPGCFATAITLALAPFVAAGLLDGPVQCVAATGSTGSGATPTATTHHPERFVNLKPYKVLRHQHTPEVETFLGTLGDFGRLHFVPLSAPVDRGILATCFLRTRAPRDPLAVLAEAYAGTPLVRVRADPPQLRHVRGTGLCHLSAARDGEQVAVMAAIDNLGKGAAAHAVQCFNRAVGLAPDTAVPRIPCLP